MGSVGARYGEDGRWNLHMRDEADEAELTPLLRMEEAPGAQWTMAAFPVFDAGKPAVKLRPVPYITLQTAEGPRRVTTVFELLAGSLGVDRGHGGDVARDYDDARVNGTPAWQEALTGVPREQVIQVARGFADNAAATNGRSMIVMGAGINHWYNNDVIYRSILSLTTLCGCQGVNGGGWAHYVGQEKVRPLSGWTTVTMAGDWTGPPRLQNGTSFYYFAIDAWRYELLHMGRMCPPGREGALPDHPADCNAVAARLGWLPFYPQFQENSLEICRKAEADGAASDEEIIKHAVARLKSGDLRMAVEAPSHEDNVPRIMCFWRTNPLGSNVKGHEYFLRHLLGTENAVRGGESPVQPSEFQCDPPMEQGKLDLMVVSEFRMSTSCVYADMVLPAAHWYEINDLSSTDMHPFIHPFTPAADPPWEARNNWEQFRTVAEVFSRLAEKHLGTRKDLVATPLLHDSPGEIAQPLGQVRDWRTGEVEPVPGKTMPGLHVVERRYADVLKMYTSLGPNIRRPEGMGVKGAKWSGAVEHDLAQGPPGHGAGGRRQQGHAPSGHGPRCLRRHSLPLAGIQRDRLGALWTSVEKRTGPVPQGHLLRPPRELTILLNRSRRGPGRALNSPNWSGLKGEQVTYTSFAQNVQRLLPFHTLSAASTSTWTMRGCAAWRKPARVPSAPAPGDPGRGERGRRSPRGHGPGAQPADPAQQVVHSLYVFGQSDHAHALARRRRNLAQRRRRRPGGHCGQRMAGMFQRQRACSWAGPLVSYRIPRGRAFIYHAQERHVGTPLSPLSGQRGGTHNSLTRPFIKPTQMIGGYGQLSYSFNYYGPTGCQRDEYIVVRKAGEVIFHEN